MRFLRASGCIGAGLAIGTAGLLLGAAVAGPAGLSVAAASLGAGLLVVETGIRMW